MSDRAASDCAAIVLAAGGSSRLGQPKQLIQIDGESLLRRTARLAGEAGCSPVFVVLGRDAKALSAEVTDLDATMVVNEEWQSGMASSLRTGLAAALNVNPEQENILVLVCDQPNLDSQVLVNLLNTHSSRQPLITVSRYGETLGVPAVFRKELFSELLKLEGDQGARRILQRHREEAAVIPFPAGEIDLDTPEDLARMNL
jgi:molybdenum cofactor cytidylyltransferase